MFYVLTTTNGEGLGKHACITAWNGRSELYTYIKNVYGSHDFSTQVDSRTSIGTMLELLYDAGPGHGARSHRRVSYKGAKALVRDGVKDTNFAFS